MMVLYYLYQLVQHFSWPGHRRPIFCCGPVTLTRQLSSQKASFHVIMFRSIFASRNFVVAKGVRPQVRAILLIDGESDLANHSIIPFQNSCGPGLGKDVFGKVRAP